MNRLFKRIIAVALMVCGAVIITGCKEDEEPFTGVKINYSINLLDAEGSRVFTPVYYNEGNAVYDVNIAVSISGDNTGGASLSASSVKSGKSLTLTAGNKKGASVTVICSCNGESASVVFITRSEAISLSDVPVGYAASGIDTSKMTNSVTVSTASELKEYATKGGYVIYVTGTIDMSEGMLPSAGSSSTDSTAKLDALVKNNASDGKSQNYAEWIKNNTNVKSDANVTPDSKLSNLYKGYVQIQVKANTAIIGVDYATIRGVTFSVSSSNVVIRNLVIQDAVDPFPHHENNDGWNAQHDGICISGGSNYWVDHCTFEDTLKMGTAANGEKWQVYDGLLDIKSACTNISVTNCIFRSHDKTMLIGSSDSDGASDKTARKITLAYNYWIDCGQRCPMVRNSKIHILNNVYDSENRYYSSQSSINARAGSSVYADDNWFGSVASPSIKDGSISYSGVSDYSYSKKSKAAVISMAGAGKLSVNK